MTIFEFLTPPPPGHPTPQSPTPGAWPRRHDANPVWYVLYLLFVRTHTQFGIKIFEIDFVIENKWYLTFFAPPQGPRGRGQKQFDVARPIYVSNLRTKFGWISSNGLGGDSITERRTDRRRRLQYLLSFLKRRGDNYTNRLYIHLHWQHLYWDCCLSVFSNL